MSAPHPLPQNPLLHATRSPQRGRSPTPPRGFSRSGFAPIPHRHSDLPPMPREREREFPRRDLDPEPEIERWERRMDREEYERRPPPHWEEEYGEWLRRLLDKGLLAGLQRRAVSSGIPGRRKLTVFRPPETPSLPLALGAFSPTASSIPLTTSLPCSLTQPPRPSLRRHRPHFPPVRGVVPSFSSPDRKGG